MTTGRPERPDPYTVELALAAALARITDAQAEAITRAWARAWSATAEDLLDTLELILADAGRVNATAVVRYERFARVLAAIADALDDLAQQLGITITTDLAEVLAMAQQGTVQLIAAQRLNQPPITRPVPSAALSAIVRRTTEQVTSLTQPLADQTYATVLRELTRGVAAGDNPRDTARRMVARAEDLVNFGRARAVNIARTETLDAYREGARATQDAHADVLAGWVWLAHLGPRTCRSCLAMHGEMFDLDVPGPLDHPQGRCGRVPVVAEENGTFDLSWLPDAEEHFESLPEADQRAILGNKGYEAWLAGDFPRELWVKRKSTEGWRDSYVPASPDDSDAGSGNPPTPRGSGFGEPPEPPVAIADKITVVDKAITPTIEQAAAAVDKVHKVPADMKVISAGFMPVAMEAAMPGTQGAYHQRPGAEHGPELWLRRPAGATGRLETTTHELGHAMDDLVFGAGESHIFGGTRTALATTLADWWATVQSTRAYTALGDMAAWDADTRGPWVQLLNSVTGDLRTWTPDDSALEYLMRPQELFARSYSQWIALVSGDPDLQLRIEQQLRLARRQGDWTILPPNRLPFYPVQWEHDDFVPVAEALARLFGSRGLLIEEQP